MDKSIENTKEARNLAIINDFKRISKKILDKYGNKNKFTHMNTKKLIEKAIADRFKNGDFKTINISQKIEIAKDEYGENVLILKIGE